VIRRFLQASIIAIAAAIAGCSLGSFESITYVNAPVDTLDNEPAQPSEPAQPMAPIVIYGDSRTGHLTHIQVVRQIVEIAPTAVFHVGDLVDDGDIAMNWDRFNDITAPMRQIAEFFPAIGNHEKMSDRYFDNFELPGNEQWYSVERNYIHFIILNSCVSFSPGSDQYDWLETNLASVPDSIKWTIAMFHHPAYSTGSYLGPDSAIRAALVPLFDQHGVDIVFAGHDHNYQRFYNGRYYIVTGGGGAPLEDVSLNHPFIQRAEKQYHFCRLDVVGDSLTVRVIDTSGQQIDAWGVR
jgi:hypothetical protein